MIPTVVGYVLGWASATLYFLDVLEHDWVKFVGFVLGGLAIGIGLAVFCLYAYFEGRLTAAEEMAAGERR